MFPLRSNPLEGVMLGWFRKRPSTSENEAFKKGEQMATEMAAVLDEFVRLGLGPYREHQLGRLRELIIDSLGSSDGPPIILARKAYKDFLNSLAEHQTEVRDRTRAALKKWLDLAAELHLGDSFEKLIQHRLSGFHEQLQAEVCRLSSIVLKY
jgi:hypothetical protein